MKLFLQRFIVIGTAFGVLTSAIASAVPVAERARLIVLADMGNEPDEEQQMIHLLMCSNEIDLEGLIAVSGQHLRPEDPRPYRQVLHPELFHLLIHGYSKVYANLQLHALGWHTPEYLHGIVASGQTGYGIADTGDGKFSAGSRLIIAVVTKSDPRPVHIVGNAGLNTLAQALLEYRATHSPAEVAAFVGKLRVYENQAQDNAGAWICHEFPDIHWIRSNVQTRCYGGPDNQDFGPHVWRPFPYSTAGQDAWAREHVRENHGALGSLYPQRKVFTEDLHFIEGGGTIPWMRLVSRGLTDPSEPSWGGWSGRFTREKQVNPSSRYKDIAEQERASQPFRAYTDHAGPLDRWTDPLKGETFEGASSPIWPWRQAMWDDFRARMDWCVQPFDKANHHPRAALNGDTSDAIIRLTARPGAAMAFDASGSSDPDGNTLRFLWWIDPEAGARPYGRLLPVEQPNAPRMELRMPGDAAGKELHLILEVWDESPIVPLVDYRRAVISISAP